MKQGREISAMKVPRMDFGFYGFHPSQGKPAAGAFWEGAPSSYMGRARESLDVITFDGGGNAMGSNSFAPVLINNTDGFLPQGKRVLSLDKFGAAFNTTPEFFRDTYQDLAIVLRTNGDGAERNDYLAKNLFNKLKKRGFVATPEGPVVISLTELRLIKDPNSGYGLVYGLREDANPIVVPEYGTKESMERFTLYDERGIPIPDKGGKYTIWKKDFGVSGVYSGYDQDSGSSSVHLACSYSNGRIIVGIREAVPKNHTGVETVVGEKRENRQKRKLGLIEFASSL